MVTSYEEKSDRIARRLTGAPVLITAAIRDQAIKAEFNGIIPPRAIEDVDQRTRELKEEEER